MAERQNPEREQRIDMEILADAHDREERALGWYSYLEEHLHFPFHAVCVASRAISPLKAGDEVEVIALPSAQECSCEIFVTIRWERGDLAVPLSQLIPHDQTDRDTKRAVEDWHYWAGQGYEF